MPTVNSPTIKIQPYEDNSLEHPTLPPSPSEHGMEVARPRLPEKETGTFSLSLEGREIVTGSSESHDQQPSNPQTGETSKDTGFQPSHSSSSPRSDSIGSPSPNTHEEQRSFTLAIDSERLGYAINRALRVPAISSLENDDEANNTSVSQNMSMSFDFS